MSLWLIIGSLLAADTASAAKPDSPALARQIDRRLVDRLEAEKVPPAERSTDSEFLRRVSLDLIGRIPTPQEVRVFLDESSPEKREELVDRLLSDPGHARHFADVWRALLLPEAETEPQVRYFLPGFEGWLKQRRTENAGFDVIVRELLTVPIAGPAGTPEFVLRDLKKPNPLAFIAAKNAEPAKIASSSVRLFLGLRLECAQCHDHPFDRWTRKQFWNQAAFFAGIERKGRGTFAPLIETVDRRTIPLMDTKDTVPALFLDLSEPKFDADKSSRLRFAEWMTSRDNPYFARAVVNRVWSQLMGSGIVEAVDDFRETNAPSHPELLTELADSFKASGFDVTFLLRSICRTDAYQRTSRQSHDGQARPELFARMAVKPLSGEQFVESFAQATGLEESRERNDGDEMDDNPLRRRLQALFSNEGTGNDPETSVAQALALMNGATVQRAVVPETGKRLQRTLEEFPDAPDKQVEALFLATLSRQPNSSERDTLREFFARDDAKDYEQRLGDVFWMLLNSPEFRWNH